MFFLVKWVDARDIVSALHPGNLRNLCKGSSTFSTQTSARQYLTSHLKIFNGELLRSNFDDNRFFWFKWSVWDIATQEKVYWVLLQAKNTLRHIHIEQRLSPSAQDECNKSLGSLYRENFWNSYVSLYFSTFVKLQSYLRNIQELCKFLVTLKLSE